MQAALPSLAAPKSGPSATNMVSTRSCAYLQPPTGRVSNTAAQGRQQAARAGCNDRTAAGHLLCCDRLDWARTHVRLGSGWPPPKSSSGVSFTSDSCTPMHRHGQSARAGTPRRSHSACSCQAVPSCSWKGPPFLDTLFVHASDSEHCERGVEPNCAGATPAPLQ